MDIQNNINAQPKNSTPMTKRKISCGKVILFVILGFVLYVIGNIFYGNFIKGQYQYSHSGQQVFNFKYPKKYHIKYSSYNTTNTEVNGAPKGTPVDDIIVSKKCSLFQLNFDCGYDITLRFVVYWKNNNITINDNFWNPDKNCKFEELSGKQICYIGNNRETSYIYGDDYKLEIFQSQIANQQTVINEILSTLVFN